MTTLFITRKEAEKRAIEKIVLMLMGMEKLSNEILEYIIEEESCKYSIGVSCDHIDD